MIMLLEMCDMPFWCNGLFEVFEGHEVLKCCLSVDCMFEVAQILIFYL
jgi:hypothetical protein